MKRTPACTAWMMVCRLFMTLNEKPEVISTYTSAAESLEAPKCFIRIHTTFPVLFLRGRVSRLEKLCEVRFKIAVFFPHHHFCFRLR